MMKDVFLRFGSHEEMTKCLIQAGFKESEYEQDSFYLKGVSVDIIGAIYKSPGKDEENTDLISVAGHHVNLRVTDEDINLSVLDDFSVYPETPYRVWA